ncbi:putative membrane protein [Rhodobium orientis]|uniref:Manganese transporter n=1 Tax=Rhodobium orientis TaxID=34017 RepID=A0A327JL34_9HYPH|nr:putative manganese transporter [Rhodobium orientis]MBB4302892.1 putative membrane protein [Rhodobium orientis]MBK5949453.1 hypothetical protein [Rhodobium orientis]RAI26023.1 hypothetical protein CH339_15835 [Rhodobium orientis]
MTEFTLSTGRLIAHRVDWRVNPHWWRIILLAAVALLLISDATKDLTASALADAYLQVTVFVAGTLFLVNFVEAWLRMDVGVMLARSARWQPLIASLLGAMPGCGGAIIVVTQYTRGYTTFGSVVAVLVATMGDAAFLLIARDPATALMVIAVSLVVGTISGAIVDAVHGADFLHEEAARGDPDFGRAMPAEPTQEVYARISSAAWLALLLPGLVLGVFGALQIDADALMRPLSGAGLTEKIGVVGALLCLAMWAFSIHGNSHTIVRKGEGLRGSTVQRTIADTNFVTGWVVMAFLAFELTVFLFGIDLKGWFGEWAIVAPLAGLAVGMIPGCGPQIIVTTLYLAGAIPLSAQLTNAIANDGDALFPAIALAPRAAFLASVYSAVPAVLVGYGYFFLFEF